MTIETARRASLEFVCVFGQDAFQDATFLLLRQLVKNLSQMPPNRPVDFLPSVFGNKDNMVFAVVPRVR